MVRVRNDRLRAAREASPSPRTPGACLSRDELAEAVNTWLADHTGSPGALDGQAVARWERGAVQRPHRDHRSALRAILDADDVALGFATAEGPRSSAPTPWTAALDPERVLGPEADERVRAAARYPRRTDRCTLDALAEVLAGVRHLEDETSAAGVAPAVAAQADLADRLADHAPGALRARAIGLCSEIAQYQGWLAIPGHQWENSRRHLDRAISVAVEAEDASRLATALSFAAYRAMRCEQLDRAEALSRAAGRDAAIGTGLRTYLAFQRAEILARAGRGREAAGWLVTADDLIEHLPPADQLPAAGYWYVPSFFLGQRAFVLDALGDRAAARESALACLAEMPAEWSASEWAGRRRDLARA